MVVDGGLVWDLPIARLALGTSPYMAMYFPKRSRPMSQMDRRLVWLMMYVRSVSMGLRIKHVWMVRLIGVVGADDETQQVNAVHTSRGGAFALGFEAATGGGGGNGGCFFQKRSYSNVLGNQIPLK